MNIIQVIVLQVIVWFVGNVGGSFGIVQILVIFFYCITMIITLDKIDLEYDI